MDLADLVGEVGGRQAGGEQLVDRGNDLDLAEVAAGHVGVENVGKVLDPRGQLVVGVLAQSGRVVAAGQHHRDDREDRGRHLLDGQVDVGGSWERMALMRFQVSCSARRMSVPGLKSMEISLPPRMVLERTWATPMTC